MYLRARNLSLEFPLATSGQGHGTAPADDSPLGGQIRKRGRRLFVQALDDVSFDLEHGDRLALIGHNGSGKSTLLRVLAGIYHPTAGQVERSGSVSGIFNMSLGFRQEATGYRNLVLKGLMAGRTRAEIDAAMPEIAEFTGLGPYLDVPLHTYSQGMAMRLAFAATTAFSNDILVMDEWIGAGDAAFKEKIIGRMTDFVHASTIIVIASHSAGLLRRIANKAVWLEHGRIRMAGGLEVLDAYEATAAHARLAPAVRALVEAGSGLWSAPASREIQAAHLLWHLQGSSDELQLLAAPPGLPRRIMRHTIDRQGACRLPPWAVPGTVFEVHDLASQSTVASLILRDEP